MQHEKASEDVAAELTTRRRPEREEHELFAQVPLGRSIGMLVLVVFVFVASVPGLALGFLHGDAASYFAVGVCAVGFGAGLWWLKRRDRRRAENQVVNQQSKSEEAEAEPVSRSPPSEIDSSIRTEAQELEGEAAVSALDLFESRLRSVTPRVWVVPIIIALNAGVYVAMVGSGLSPLSPSASDLVAWGADYGPRTLGGQPWRLFTSTFLHFGFVHLLLNMVVLWNAGPVVERVFGHAEFAALYLVAGVAGGLASLFFHPRWACAGASGAVFGVYGALGAFLVREREALPRPVVLHLSQVAIGFVVYNMFYSFTATSIDAAAHLGGLFGGAAAGAWLSRPLTPQRPRSVGKALVVCSIAIVGIAAATSVLPKPADLDETLGRFTSDADRILATYSALAEKARRRELSDSEFARKLQASVVGPWIEAEYRVSSPNDWTAEEREIVELFAKYGKAQGAAFALLATALSKHDENALIKSRRYSADAERLMQEIKGRSK